MPRKLSAMVRAVKEQKPGDLLWIACGAIALGAALLSLVLVSEALMNFAALLLGAGGTLQILRGVYVKKRSRDFLRTLIEDETKQPTVFVREVVQTRALIGLLKDLKTLDPSNGLGQWQSGVDALIAQYGLLEQDQRSFKKRRNTLTHKRIAMGLLAASYNTFWGTAMIVLGMLIAFII